MSHPVTAQVEADMKALLELDYPEGSPFRNVHRYFATCMDQDAVEEASQTTRASALQYRLSPPGEKSHS